MTTKISLSHTTDNNTSTRNGWAHKEDLQSFKQRLREPDVKVHAHYPIIHWKETGAKKVKKEGVELA